MTFNSFFPMVALCVLASCSNSSKQNNAEGATADSVQASVMSFQDCDLTLGGIRFTKMLNGADRQVSEKDGVITFVAPEKTDLFIDPNDAKLTSNTAKVLFAEVDNTKPFTFSARMKPGFTPDGLYHAADLIVMANDTLYQKFCFEQDERGKHRVVTVRTVGTSDDNNHEVVHQDFIYYKISSDTHHSVLLFAGWQGVADGSPLPQQLSQGSESRHLLAGTSKGCMCE